MRRVRAALAVATGLSLMAIPVMAISSGSGGAGGGIPSGGLSSPEGPQYDPAVEYQQGTSDLSAGRYRNAVDDFNHVIDVTPKDADAWLMLGMSKSGAGDVKGAEKAYERSVKLDGSSIAAHRELALSLIKLKQPDKANAELTALQARATTCASTCHEAADLDAAIAAIKAALAPSAGPAAANDAPSALSLATPHAGDGAYVQAVSLINERRWDEALAALDKAQLALGPHPDILTYKGYVWRRKGDWTRATDYYTQALAIAPNHRGATEYFGELKVIEGDMAGARAMLAKLDATCAFGCAEAEELRLWIDHGGDPAA
jgi:Flp pilus assembly protein TadD